jgi:phage gp29-like protein
MAQGIWINEKEFVSLGEMKNSSLLSELATRDNSFQFFTSMFGYLPNPDQVLRSQGKDITVYEEIEGDPKVTAVIEQRSTTVEDLLWEIDRGKAKSREAKLIEKVFKDLDVRKATEDIMETPFYGYTILEIIWKQIGGYYLPVQLINRPREWFVFGYQKNELRFRSKAHSIEGEPVNMNQFLVVQYRSSYKNPYGKPILSKCFWPVTFKRGGMKFFIMFVEKYGMPWVIGKQPRGQGEVAANQLVGILMNMVQDAVAVIPDDASVDIKEPGGKGQSADIYKYLRDACNEEIALAALSETLTTQVGDKGSYAASKTHGDRLDRIGGKDQYMTENTFNELIKKIYDINFTSSSRAEFIMYPEEDVDKDMADRDKVLTETGIKFTKDYYKKYYGLTEEEFEISLVPGEVMPLPGEGTPLPGDGEIIEGKKVEAVLLNGTQIASAAKIIAEVSAGNIPRDSGINQLMVFLGLDARQAEAVMGDSGTGKMVKADKVVEGAPGKNIAVPSNGNGKQPKTVEFAEPVRSNSINEFVEEAMGVLPDKLLQAQIEQTLKPVIDLIESGTEFSEIQNKLAGLYPKMKTTQLEQLLQKIFFIAEIKGRLEAE